MKYERRTVLNEKKSVEEFVEKKIKRILAEAGQPEGKAMLSHLRHGIGHSPGDYPELFGILLMDMPEEFLSITGIPTKEEWACYTALTLFALHQQGISTQYNPMHTDEKVSLGNALSILAKISNDDNAQQRMLQRLKIVATSKDMNELAYHLRGIIQLLNKESIPLNYAQLAGDVFEFQFWEQSPKVCLRWGQDFFRLANDSNNGGKENE